MFRKACLQNINTTYKADRLRHMLYFKLRKWLFPSFQRSKRFCWLSHV